MAPECTSACRSKEHGLLVTAAIVRGTEAQAIAYMKHVCQRSCYVTDNTGKSALHTAVSCGKRKVVRWLLAQGIPLNQKDWESGYTPLHRALFYGQLHAACCIIEAGANISTPDNDSLTPLDHVNFDRPPYVSFSYSLPTQLYVWGTNANYNLGQINSNAKGTPECLDVFQRENQQVRDIVLSKFHTLFLTASGQVYTCGHGRGGRLGLNIQTPVISPRLVKTLANVKIVKVSASTDHSLFLTETGQVWSCGVNDCNQLGVHPSVKQLYTPQVLQWHKANKEEAIEGIGAAKYHSVIWSSKVLYTFGLNAGQMGHFKNPNEKTIVNPRRVTSVALKDDGTIKCVGVSDGATVVCTSVGDIYVLHQYQTRKIASKVLKAVKVACVGGCLDSSVNTERLTEKGGTELKIAVLTGEGTNKIYIWTEQTLHLSRCLFNIGREINVLDFCLSHHLVGIVTTEGEAFSANIVLPRERKTTEKGHNKSSGQLVEFLDRSMCITLRLTRLPCLHRTLSIRCDPKGSNFAAIQNEPNCFLMDVPQVSPSTMRNDLRKLLQECNEMDNLSDVVIVCGQRKFYSHSYILARQSQYFRNGISDGASQDGTEKIGQFSRRNFEEGDKKHFALPDIDPDVFQDILTYMYTGTSQVLVDSDSFEDLHKIDSDVNGNEELDGNEPEDPDDWLMSFPVGKKKVQKKPDNNAKKSNGINKDPIHVTLSVAKRLGIRTLEHEISNMLNVKNNFGIKTTDSNKTAETLERKKFSRKECQDLWDVKIISKTGETLGAHKCVLSARLEYFHCMFGASWIESTSSKALTMPLPTNILAIILDYLYEDDSQKLRMCSEAEFVCNVLVVADQFLMFRLREVCEAVLTGLLSLKNATDLLEFAHIYNADQLKASAMQFICLNLAAVLENGSLLSINSSDILSELTRCYRNFIPRMSCRILTPFDQHPYTDELERLLEEHPLVLPESDEDWEDFNFSREKHASGGGGSSRKKKRVRRASQGESRTRNSSTSSQLSVGSMGSDPDALKDLEQEFEALDFDDLEERVPEEETTKVNMSFSRMELGTELIIPKTKKINKGKMLESSLWQTVGKKKNSISHPTLDDKETTKEIVVQGPPPPKEVQPRKQPSRPKPSPQKVEIPKSSPGNQENSSATEFPSLADSFTRTPKPTTPRSNKIGKMPQKQSKKLSLPETVMESSRTDDSKVRKTSLGSATWGQSSPAWGLKQETIGVSKNGPHAHSLADIMKAQEASTICKAKPVSAPIAIQSRKSSQGSTPTKKSWGMTDPTSPQPLSSSADQGGMWLGGVGMSSPTSPPTSLGHTPSGHSQANKTPLSSPLQDFAAPSFSKIIKEEQIMSNNFKRERFKSLGLIQMEDRAIEELLAFYGAGECSDENITVKRVRSAIANPIWNK